MRFVLVLAVALAIVVSGAAVIVGGGGKIASPQRAGAGLPLAPVLDLRLHTPSDTRFAATFGRSVWKIDVGR
jgi:hypothetical protein